MIFDGRAFAKELEKDLATRVAQLPHKPKMVSVLVGDDPASVMYTQLKNKAANRCGIDFSVEKLDSRFKIQEIKERIAEIGAREDVTGLMVQLPIPGLDKSQTQEVLKAIPLNKDVDGLRWEESGVMPATVKAIFSILEKINLETRIWNLESRFVVLGARGAVGKPLVYYLQKQGVKVDEVEWDTPDPARMILAGEVVISCVGKPGVVTEKMIKPSMIMVDVGAPVGDMTSGVYQKAAVAVPVPGGVGPVTVVSLMENAVDLVL